MFFVDSDELDPREPGSMFLKAWRNKNRGGTTMTKRNYPAIGAGYVDGELQWSSGSFEGGQEVIHSYEVSRQKVPQAFKEEVCRLLRVPFHP